MSDFGAVLLFFIAFLVTAYMRSGDLKTVVFAIASAVFGGVIIIKFKPYILTRFATWLHAWQWAYDGGYQQTRTMSAAASGGLLGLGAGNGWLQRIPAADTDLVFGVVSEELGLITGICAVACVVVLAIFVSKSAFSSRSAFYTIAASAAATMLVFQMTLNVLGSVDILPLTGVTFPLVSNGGSSLVSSFGMLAFIKAIDTRQNASFASMPQKNLFKKGARAYEKAR
jgi:cell division protein FtsW (lipid II flippase)